jgi:predicted ArsR family transcriptional regulator
MPNTGINWRTVAVQMEHPLRVRIIECLATRQEASPTELAEHLHVDLPKLSYHMQVLLRAKVIRRTRTRQVRGALQSFYAVRKGVVHE